MESCTNVEFYTTQNTNTTRNTTQIQSKLQQEIIYGHLTSDHNINISRKKRIKQDILQEFISNTNKVSQTRQPNNLTQQQNWAFQEKNAESKVENKVENNEPNSSSQSQIPSQSIQNNKEPKEHISTKTLSSQLNFNKDKVPVQKLHKESNNVNSILDRDSGTNHQISPTSEQQIRSAIPSQQSKEANHQELDTQAEHSYQSKDASTQEIYIAGIQDGYDRRIFKHYRITISHYFG